MWYPWSVVILNCINSYFAVFPTYIGMHEKSSYLISKCCQIHHQSCLVVWMMFSNNLMSRDSQVSNPGPLGTLVQKVGPILVPGALFEQTW